MNKKAILGVIFTLSLVFSGLNFSSASAVGTEVSDETVNQPIELSDDVDTSTATPTSEPESTSDTTHTEFVPGLIVQHDGEGGENGRICLMEGDIAIPCPAECHDENGEFQPCVYNKETNTYTPYQTILDEGTSGEPEVVCADKSEPGCEDTDSNPEEVATDGEEEELEPELWPLILSLSALGATIVFVIIINLFGRKK